MEHTGGAVRPMTGLQEVFTMQKDTERTDSIQDTGTAPALEPEINEADGSPIFHADEEEGEDSE